MHVQAARRPTDDLQVEGVKCVKEVGRIVVFIEDIVVAGVLVEGQGEGVGVDALFLGAVGAGGGVDECDRDRKRWSWRWGQDACVTG